MSKIKLFLIKVGIIPAPKGFKYSPVDADKDGVVQEKTKFERNVTLEEVKEKRPVKKAPAKKPVKKDK